MLQVVDETCALVEALVVSVVSDPAKLAKIMAALLGIAFIGLLVGNSVTLAGTTPPAPRPPSPSPFFGLEKSVTLVASTRPPPYPHLLAGLVTGNYAGNPPPYSPISSFH